ncbi:MAG: hypothetical protein NVS1B14_01650 [Vulcanimicrobiaceae bacterium]
MSAIGLLLGHFGRRRRQREYAAYLSTDAWREKRAARVRMDAGSCRICDSEADLQVHHRRYVRRGEETMDDLTTLCGACHTLHHAAREGRVRIRPAQSPLRWIAAALLGALSGVLIVRLGF